MLTKHLAVMQRMVSMMTIMSSARLGVILVMKAGAAWLLSQLRRQHTRNLRLLGKLFTQESFQP